MKKDEKRDDKLTFWLIILFMVMIFGHNLRFLQKEEKYKLPGIRYEGEEVIDSAALFMKPAVEKEKKRKKKKEKEKVAERKQKYRVVATVYNPLSSQCDSDPLITADGKKINLNKLKNKKLKWIAISQDLTREIKYGTRVKLSSKSDPSINGIYEVHDCMNQKYKKRIDILYHQDHRKDGFWEDVILEIS